MKPGDRLRFRVMRDLSPEEAIDFLRGQDVAHLAVVAGGEPYVTPISFAVGQNELYFRTGGGRRLDAIAEHPRVCVEASAVDAEHDAWDSVCVWGDAYVVDDAHQAGEAIALLLEKYREAIPSVLSFSQGPNLADASKVVAVPIDEVTGRSSGRDLKPRLRPGRL